jgi:DNA-binding transcriptional LysR family regulator
VDLFVRSRRRVELIAAGRAFRAGALEVLAATERAVGDARRAARGETGRLTVGFAGSAGYDVFPEAVRRFRRWARSRP